MKKLNELIVFLKSKFGKNKEEDSVVSSQDWKQKIGDVKVTVEPWETNTGKNILDLWTDDLYSKCQSLKKDDIKNFLKHEIFLARLCSELNNSEKNAEKLNNN